MDINLGNNRAYKWKKRGTLLYVGNVDTYNNSDLIQALDHCCEYSELLKLIDRMQGEFSIIKQLSDMEFVIASDISAAFPVFYDEECCTISDNCSYIADRKEHCVFNYDNLACWVSSSYVMSGQTVYTGIYKCEAGQVIYINELDRSIKREFYFFHYNPSVSMVNTSSLKEELGNTLDDIFVDLIKSLDGRCVVLPLSGGYDSRLIAAELKKHGYENVICFTYGLKGKGDEVEFSEKVANALGYPWYFIEYSKEKWDNLLSSSVFDKYCNYSCNYFISPHIQEIIAISSLKEKNIIPSNSVVIPGFSADLPAGSYIAKELLDINSIDELGQFIYAKHFNLVKLKDQFGDSIINAVTSQIKRVYCLNDLSVNKEQIVKVYDAWVTQNRVTQYIINALRIYDYYGLEWRIPFWDRRFLNFWYKLGVKERIDCNLYIEFLFMGIFRDFNVNFKKPQHVVVRNRNDKRIKTAMLKIYDYIITSFSIKKGYFVLQRNNINNFNYVSHVLYSKINNKRIVNKHYMGLMQMITLYSIERVIGSDQIRCVEVN